VFAFKHKKPKPGVEAWKCITKPPSPDLHFPRQRQRQRQRGCNIHHKVTPEDEALRDPTSRQKLEQFIHAKFVEKRFVKDDPTPVTW
jgi:hypothetical protein